jgi:flagellar biosynthesis chaperone FliJ
MAEYRLQTLLELRARAKEAADRVFAQAIRDLTSARLRLEQLEGDLRTRRDARKQKVRTFMQDVIEKGGGAGGFDQMHRFEERLKDEELAVAAEVDRQRELVEHAARALEVKRDEVADAAKAFKAIEKHKERWARQIRLEREARDELSQEEIGNALHLMRSRK